MDMETVLTALAALAVPVAGAVWVWFKARAKRTPETWDDKLVDSVEDAAQRARDNEG